MKKTVQAVMVALLLAPALLLLAPAAASAQTPAPYPGTKVVETGQPFADYIARLKNVIRANRMGIVAEANATAGAASIGVTIPGNRVIMIYRPDFAVRMLNASTEAGIEAPLRLYVTENDDGTARLTYRTPSAVFAPYGVAALDEMAAELDEIVETIVAQSLDG